MPNSSPKTSADACEREPTATISASSTRRRSRAKVWAMPPVPIMPQRSGAVIGFSSCGRCEIVNFHSTHLAVVPITSRPRRQCASASLTHVARYDRVVSTNDDVYLRVAERFGVVLSRVANNQWDDPTPCDEWTVHDLGAHVIATHRRVYALVDPEGLAAIDEEAPLIDQWSVVATTMRLSLI